MVAGAWALAMNSVKEEYYRKNVLKGSAATAVALVMFIADELDGFHRNDQLGRSVYFIVGGLGTIIAIYFWRKLYRSRRPSRPETKRRLRRRNPVF